MCRTALFQASINHLFCNIQESGEGPITCSQPAGSCDGWMSSNATLPRPVAVIAAQQQTWPTITAEAAKPTSCCFHKNQLTNKHMFHTLCVFRTALTGRTVVLTHTRRDKLPPRQRFRRFSQTSPEVCHWQSQAAPGHPTGLQSHRFSAPPVRLQASLAQGV